MATGARTLIYYCPSVSRFGAQLRDEERSALHDVYRGNVTAVYAFFSYSVDSSTAEELTAATFERVVRSWRRFDASRGSVTVWVLAIARNILTDHYRRRRHRAGPSLDEFPALAGNLVAVEDAAGSWLDIDAVLGWLAELPPRERQVLGLRYGADLSAQEIAGCLDLSEANVQQIASRGLRRLRTTAEAPGLNGNCAADAARVRVGRSREASHRVPRPNPDGARRSRS